MWTPQFECPECRGDVDSAQPDIRACRRCGLRYELVGGIWRFLSAADAARLAPFLRQYRSVRGRDGHRVASPDYYRLLPVVPSDDPGADEWRVRRQSYQHLLRHVLAGAVRPLRVLDLGAGSAWLSHRLATLGHHAVAVDVLDDEVDGLGVANGSRAAFTAVQADFDALPLAAGQFDLVVFNGALHYAPDVGATLERAHRMLGPGGGLVVMDSPMFHAEGDGSAMVADMVRRFAADYGCHEVVRPGAGYLTFTRLARTAESLHVRARFLPSRGSLPWRLRRSLTWLRRRRAPAGFGLWVAR